MGQRTVRLVRPAAPDRRRPPTVERLVREKALFRLAAGEVRPRVLAASLLRLVDLILRSCPCEVLIGDIRTGYLEVVGTRGFRAERGLGCRIPIGVGVTGYAARLGRSIWVPDVSTDPRYIPAVSGARWELALPLRAGERVVGVVDLESAQARRPGVRLRRYLAAMAQAVAPAFARSLPAHQPASLRLLAPTAPSRPATSARPDQPDLQSILAGRRLNAVYQPVMELQHRRIVGYEAVVSAPRGTPWDTPERLLAVSRDGHFAVSLDGARLQAALAGFRAGAGRLFLDVRTATLRRPEFLTSLPSFVREHGLAPTDLVLEIPDAGLHVDEIRRMASALRGSGVEVALDRFGSGAADVRALVELHPAFVKLDASLIRGVDRDFGRRTYIESLCYYTRRTGTEPVALGVATADEVSSLRRCGVAYGQGEAVGPAAPLQA